MSHHLPRRLRALPALACLAALAALPLTTSAADGAKPDPGARALAQRHGCLGCHAVESQLVGPAYKAVAERYAGKAGAGAELAASIRAGGSKRWGEMAMPPQPQVSEADARRLANWILSGAK